MRRTAMEAAAENSVVTVRVYGVALWMGVTVATGHSACLLAVPKGPVYENASVELVRDEWDWCSRR